MKLNFSWLSPKLIAKDTNKCGMGIFSRENIKKGSTLSILGGYVMSALEEDTLPDEIKDYGMQISEEFVLGVRKLDEIEDACYINHSCDPNAGIKGQIYIVAMRDIDIGEQITFDYAMCLHKVKDLKKFKMNCLCGSPNCRKVITEDDWKIPALQKKYDGYFQWYLQEKINRLKEI